jgi:signal transduction histidine kinase
VVVDDEPAVLAAVARDLRRGFGERFVEQQHDGTLSFDTGDEGTTFRVWLPLH